MKATDRVTDSQAPTIIFLHIPKTAGTTLAQIMTRQYIGQPTYVFNQDTTHKLDHLLSLPESERAALRFMSGHIRYGVHRYLPGESRYLTILRDPRDRLISLYYYALDNPNIPSHEQATEQTFTEFLTWKVKRSSQLDFIVGLDEDNEGKLGAWGKNRKLPLATKLEIAEQHLREHFDVVGLVEHFDTSLMLMRHAFGWRNLYYARRRVGKSRPRGRDAESLRTTAEEYAAEDIPLYELAQRIFEEQCAAYGPSLDQDVQTFQRNNAIMGRMIATTADLRRAGLYRQLRRRLTRR